MKLKEYIKQLQQIVKENPEAKNFEVIYAEDSEGNSFDVVYFTPQIGMFVDGEFITDESDDSLGEYKTNSVCIN